MSAREYLEKANRYQVKPEELFQYFAQDVLQITVLYQKSSMGKKPLLARSNRPGSKYIVAFTDQEAAKMVRVSQPEFLEMSEEPALEFMLKAYRSNAEGLMFNPGLDSRFFVVRHQLLDWIRYYCINKFSKQSTAWVIKNGSSVLKGSYQPGFSTIVVYTGEEEANKSAEKSGGEATPVSWEDIFRYLERLGSKTLYINYGLPEAFLLNPEQVNQIRGGSKTGYVEQTTNSYSFIPEVSDADLSPSTLEEETAVSIPVEIPLDEEQSEGSKEETGDWESVFQEEEPLTSGKDTKISDTYVNVPMAPVEKAQLEVNEEQTIASVEKKEEQIAVEVKPTIKETKAEVVESTPVVPEQKVEEMEPKPKVIEQEVEKTMESVKQQHTSKSNIPLTEQKTSSASQNTYSAFDNPWDDDDDGFSEPVPHTSLFFQSNNKEQEEQNHTAPSHQQSNPEPIVEEIHQPEPEPMVQQNQAPVEEQPVLEKKIDSEPVSTHQPISSNSDIPEDVQYGLRVLETATNEGQGMANGWEVCRALADLRRIWVIVDIEGKMVILASQNENQIADFFTSEEYAQTLIEEAHKRNNNLPQMVPRLISTKKLFRALAPTGCIIWINRGSSNAWTSIMGDTLPYVLQLMAQK